MESRKMILLNLFEGEQWDAGIENRLVDTIWEGEGGMTWESNMETYISPYVK